MSLKKEFIRDGQRKIVGSITTGYTGSFDTLVRDEHEHIVGRTSEHFGTGRARGRRAEGGRRGRGSSRRTSWRVRFSYSQ
jgi:hypothetical protein